jgi:glycosyltransferase involved in cell wall biosynthesis
MRIAVVTTSYPFFDGDPSGHFVQAEVAELQRMGHDVHVVHPTAGGAFGWPGAPTRLRERPLRAFEAGAWLVSASLKVKRLRPDRIVAHWSVPCAFPIALAADAAAAATAAAPRPELDIVSHGGDVRLLVRLPREVRIRIVRPLLRRATRWRFVSQDLRLSLERSLDEDDVAALAKIAAVVPQALEIPDVTEDARAKRQAVAGRRLYVCAGRLVASKRVDKVIDYVATSGTDRDKRVLVILGDGPERANLERMAKAWQIDVRFLGKTSRREALSWIRAADELVHASRVEGLSTVVREASMLGVPVTILP